MSNPDHLPASGKQNLPSGDQSYGSTDSNPVGTPGREGADQLTHEGSFPGAGHGARPSGYEASASGSGSAADLADTAREEGRNLAQSAGEAGGRVAESAKQEASEVFEEVKVQGRQLLDESMLELRSQAGTGQMKVAELTRALGAELDTLAQAEPNGMLSQYLGRAHELSTEAAHWLENNEPEELLDSVRRYAARRPVAFLAIAAGIGFVGARLVRGLQNAKTDETGEASQPRSYPATRRSTSANSSDDGFPVGTEQVGGLHRVDPYASVAQTEGRYEALGGSSGLDLEKPR